MQQHSALCKSCPETIGKLQCTVPNMGPCQASDPKQHSSLLMTMCVTDATSVGCVSSPLIHA